MSEMAATVWLYAGAFCLTAWGCVGIATTVRIMLVDIAQRHELTEADGAE